MPKKADIVTEISLLPPHKTTGFLGSLTNEQRKLFFEALDCFIQLPPPRPALNDLRLVIEKHLNRMIASRTLERYLQERRSWHQSNKK